MKIFSRRQFLQMTAGLGLASVLPQSSSSLASLWSQVYGQAKREILPITPNEEFFLTSYRTSPFLPADQWTFSIHGAMRRSFTLNYSQLLEQPSASEIVPLECVGNGVGGEAIGTAE